MIRLPGHPWRACRCNRPVGISGHRSAWGSSSLPLDMKVATLVKFGDLPVQFSGSYEYNFADDDVAPKWAVNFTVMFLFPL